MNRPSMAMPIRTAIRRIRSGVRAGDLKISFPAFEKSLHFFRIDLALCAFLGWHHPNCFSILWVTNF